MKRKPRDGEPTLIHRTSNTGDQQAFAICDENYKPEIISQMRTMLREPLAGYRLVGVYRNRTDHLMRFDVARADGARLTENWISKWGADVLLHTTILADAVMPPEETLMLADLEQCAALMLVKEEKL